MIEFRNVEVFNLEGAIRGIRNSWNSHDKSDSGYQRELVEIGEYYAETKETYVLGENDKKLSLKLNKAGASHAKYLRQIMMSVDINAPLYWWKQFDQYKVGTTTNSESTMHQIQAKPFSLDMFSIDTKENNYSFEVEIEETEEVWVDVEGYESEYQISNTGRIRSVQRTVVSQNGTTRVFEGKELKPQINSSGYKKVILHQDGVKKNFYLHRLLAKHFIKNEFDWKTEVNHKDGNKLNNNLSNLEWVSKSENALHAFEMGLSKISGYNKSKVRKSIGKFNEDEIKEIKRLKEEGTKINEIAKRFNCYSSTICNIVNNKSYKDIEFDDYDVIKLQLDYLELLRLKFIETKDKKTWDLLIALLPSGFNQMRTTTMNYAVLANIYHDRKHHKLDEWKEMCKWIETLPYSELITGGE